MAYSVWTLVARTMEFGAWAHCVVVEGFFLLLVFFYVVNASNVNSLTKGVGSLNNLIYWWTVSTCPCLLFVGNDGVPTQEDIKANICGIMDKEINSLSSKLVVWVPLDVTSMHVLDRQSGTGLMGMFNTRARCQFRQAHYWKENLAK